MLSILEIVESSIELLFGRIMGSRMIERAKDGGGFAIGGGDGTLFFFSLSRATHLWEKEKEGKRERKSPTITLYWYLHKFFLQSISV